jgi:hypothetical protein
LPSGPVSSYIARAMRACPGGELELLPAGAATRPRGGQPVQVRSLISKNTAASRLGVSLAATRLGAVAAKIERQCHA